MHKVFADRAAELHRPNHGVVPALCRRKITRPFSRIADAPTALAAAFLFAAASPATIPSARVELQDQFGESHRIVFPRARIVVLALADREGSDQLEDWIRPLVGRYQNTIDIRGVARLAGVPAILRPVLRAAFRRAVEQPVMMDWTGSVTSDFAYEEKLANLLVLAPEGRIEYRFNGRATPEELARCFAAIDRILETPAPREG